MINSRPPANRYKLICIVATMLPLVCRMWSVLRLHLYHCLGVSMPSSYSLGTRSRSLSWYPSIIRRIYWVRIAPLPTYTERKTTMARWLPSDSLATSKELFGNLPKEYSGEVLTISPDKLTLYLCINFHRLDERHLASGTDLDPSLKISTAWKWNN